MSLTITPLKFNKPNLNFNIISIASPTSNKPTAKVIYLPRILSRVENHPITLIGNRLCEILLVELKNQKRLYEDVNPRFSGVLDSIRVVLERYNPHSNSSLPAIDVFFESYNVVRQADDYMAVEMIYNMDLYIASIATALRDSQEANAADANAINNIISTIFMSWKWRNLGFETTHKNLVGSIRQNLLKRTESRNDDGAGLLLYRSTFNILVNLNYEEPLSGPTLQDVDFFVTLDEEETTGYNFRLSG